MKNNFLVMILVLLVALMPNIVTAATITVGPSDCSASTVNAAIAGAGEGDTIQLTCTGTITWNSQVELSGGKILKGPGIKSPNPSMSGSWPLIINSSASDTVLRVTSANNQELNRVTGFKFVGGSNANFGVAAVGAGVGKNGYGAFRIDNNYFAMDVNSRLLWLDGNEGKLTGLVDHNVLYQTYTDGNAETFVGQDWNGASPTCNGYDSRTRSFVFGDSDFIFFEDNYFFDGTIETSGGGGRYVVRHNIFDSDSIHNNWCGVDGHGADTGGWHCTGVVGGEIYNNNFTGNGQSFAQIAYLRGGKWVMHNNAIRSGYIMLEEYRALGLPPDGSGPGTGSCLTLEFNACNGAACCEAPCGAYNLQCPTDQDIDKCWPLPNQISNTFVWSNIRDGSNMPTLVDGTGYVKNYIVKNRDYWEPAYGLESALPQTCTADGNTFYGTTDSGKLFKCTSNNVWTLQYTPYTYPHPLAVEASTINAASCSQADVQAAINAASDGSTVIIPSGNCIWTTTTAGTPAVTVPDTKGLIIKGAGVEQTIIQDHTGTNYGESLLRINNAEGKPFRLTGIKFTRNIDAGSSNTAMIIVSGSSKNWRIDHCNIEYTSTTGVTIAIITDGYTYGIIDHCSFTNTYPVVFADEDASWNRPLALGTSNAVFIEDCTYINAAGSFQFSTDGRSGGRFVFRHNTLTNFQFGTHGTDGGGDRGIHTYEFYSNKLIADGTVNCYRAAELRGGTGVVFNNILIGNWGDIILQHNCACTTDPNDSRCGGAKICTGYPCLDQVGRTTDSNGDGVEDLVPLYGWNNTDDGISKNLIISAVCPAVYTYLQEGRDFYNDNVTYNPSTGMYAAQYRDDDGSIKQWKYKPYIYPHPLTLAPFGTAICSEGAISSSCWCEGMKSNGYCCHGYYQAESCDSGSGCVLPGDINCDGIVNLVDLKLVAANFGKTNSYYYRADTDSNGLIDIFDVVYVASRFT